MLEAAFNFCEAHPCEAGYTFVVPSVVSADDAETIKANRHFSSMVLRNPDPKITENSHYSWLGCFDDINSNWQLPSRLGKFIFLATPSKLTKKMVLQIKGAGHKSVICLDRENQFKQITLHQFYLWWFSENVHQRLSNLTFDSPVHKVINLLKKVPGLQKFWRKFFRRDLYGDTSIPWDASRSLPISALDLDYFEDLLNQAELASRKRKYIPNANTYIIINAGLAAGGAERQIINTLIGINQLGSEKIFFLGEYLHKSPEYDFYFPLAVEAGIDCKPVKDFVSAAADLSGAIPQTLMGKLEKLPGEMAKEIINLAMEFIQKQPSVVHAWQDSSSIKVGIAAIIAGVPRIILASRNVTPTNFAYYQEYMLPAYRALSKFNKITYLNNSEAGIKDYCSWIGLARNKFNLVRNGVNLDWLKREPQDKIGAYKKSLGIPEEALVVGSIFRFWSEKRPMLWLEVARKIALAIPDVHFLIIGDGPMRDKMEGFIKRYKLSNRIHLPGTRTDIAEPLSAMNIFILTSEFEGIPNVVLEAQWLGLPAVICDAGGAREAINEGVTGWCANDSDELSDLVKKILDNPTLQAEISNIAPEFIRQNFGLDRMVQETLNLYLLDFSQ